MNGVINILKPPGMTSHDVVSFLRKRLNIKKIGHTGTLDPGAAGVLPICIGKATKIVDYITAQDKTYICEVTFGKVTDTFDKYGKVVDEFNGDITIDYDKLKSVTQEFIGEIEQIPPTYSAIKVNGQRAYELARRGENFEIPSRKVRIYALDILNVCKKVFF
ncbi:tRNA pseudouridine(55) synthase TruB [Caloramator sp. mosi_1]|uniref:tRNA pseudouridine(55) synthase TruB n=1 Tax=Caloramator sp. mosi_1 TaxID=3023090 RepID=UPI0023616804|nr:tRNA pseudouridine(55) synthase TruB [Caloramator sp. mosi_1]WDC84006.1 tRNA pseudouridine(55) synthase TruB [Caloramator sp. mosi_1]